LRVSRKVRGAAVSDSAIGEEKRRAEKEPRATKGGDGKREGGVRRE